jgi:hypothetical protein
MINHREYYKREGGGFLQVRVMVNLMSLCVFMVHSCTKNCFNYALTNLLFSLCKSMWIIDPLVIRPNPHPKAPACSSTPKMLEARERTNLFFCCFHFWTSIWVFQGVKVHQGHSRVVFTCSTIGIGQNYGLLVRGVSFNIIFKFLKSSYAWVIL